MGQKLLNIGPENWQLAMMEANGFLRNGVLILEEVHESCGCEQKRDKYVYRPGTLLRLGSRLATSG